MTPDDAPQQTAHPQFGPRREDPAIQLQGVSRIYSSSDEPALRDVSLTICRGEYVAIVGPSGSGKSTLLNMIGLLDTPSSGELLLFGEDLKGMRQRRRDAIRSHSIGFVFQSSHVIGSESVIANAAIGLRVQGVPLVDRAGSALEALEFVGLEHKRRVLAKLLSGGERQRLAIARAISTRPLIVLADEPTGNLDPGSRERVIQYLRKMNSEGATVVIVTHDREVASQADRRIEIRDGLLVLDSLTPSGRNTSEVREKGDQGRTLPPSTRPRGQFLRSLSDDWGDAFNALSSRVLRTVTLILAFAIAIGGMTAAIGIGSTTSNSINNRLAIASQDRVSLSIYDGPSVLNSGFEDLELGVQRISEVPRVVAASYLFSAVAADVHITHITPTEPEPDAPLTLHAASSSYFSDLDIETYPRNASSLLDNAELGPLAIVSTKAAEELGISFRPGYGPAPGSSIWVEGTLVPVVGIFRPAADSAELSSAVFVDPDSLRGVTRTELKVSVRTEKGFAAPVAKVASLAYAPGDPGKARVDVGADIQSIRQEVSSDLGALIALLSLVLILLATLTAASSMYLTVQSRSAEIALRRAIGATRWLVCRTFILEGLIIGAIAGLAGGILGTATTIIVSLIQGWPPVLPSEMARVSFMLGITTGVVSAIYPAWVASRKDPAIAIRD